MPDRNLHILQASKNEQFFQTFDLDSTPYRDWAVASLFYSALHLVDAYLARHTATVGGQIPGPVGGHHPNSHKERRDKILSIPVLAVIGKPYHDLKNRCDDVRYRLLDLQPAMVKRLAANQFSSVKNHLLPLI